MIGLAFCPKILGLWWEPTNDVCCSVNVDGVVILLGGGDDTSTLHYVIKVVSTFCDLAWFPLHPLYLPSHPSHPLAPLVSLAPLAPAPTTLAPARGTRVQGV